VDKNKPIEASYFASSKFILHLHSLLCGQFSKKNFFKATENATSVFETTCDSVIVPIPKGIVQNPSSKNNCFINYEVFYTYYRCPIHLFLLYEKKID